MMLQKKQTKYINWLVSFIIVTLAISPAFALGDGNRNLLLIGMMSVFPYFFFRYPIIIPQIDIPLIFLCSMMIVFPFIFHPETLRWSTVLYSCMFCMYFMAFVRILYHSNYTLWNFSKLLKGLIYAYCIVLIIQQFCVIAGLPIFNVSNYSVTEPFKLNSLTAEPSHSARIIPILIYIYICCQIKILGDVKTISLKDSFMTDKWVWFAFFWTTFTMVSATAFIFMIIVFAKFINIKKIVPSLFIVAMIGLFFAMNSNNKMVKRVIDVASATITFNEKAIIKADHSASFRIVPTIQGAKSVGIFDLDDWIGHGIDADQRMIKPLPSVKFGSAGAFYLWFNFGLIVAFIFWLFTLKICCINGDFVSIWIWFLCVFMVGGLNNQILWLVIVLITTYKYLNRK